MDFNMFLKSKCNLHSIHLNYHFNRKMSIAGHRPPPEIVTMFYYLNIITNLQFFCFVSSVNCSLTHKCF